MPRSVLVSKFQQDRDDARTLAGVTGLAGPLRVKASEASVSSSIIGKL